MQKQFMGRWGFLIAGFLFLFAALIPMADGRRMNPAFFVIAMAFFAIGSAIARRNRPAK